MIITERIHNAETGEIQDIEREETAAEKKNRELFEAEILEHKKQSEAKATARQAVLDRLGLTAEEAQLLLGGN
jgi:hypothetical protein